MSIHSLAKLLDFEDETWRDSALCAEVDNDIFFPEKGGSTKPAKRICAACGVREECLQFALDNQERFGIYGGLSERERRKLETKPRIRVGISFEQRKRTAVERDARIAALDASGLSPKEIADEVGVAYETVLRARKRHAALQQNDEQAA